MKKSILIVEDEKDVALLYSKFLTANGYQTTVAFDGLEALEKLKSFTPDLILLDLMMPRMNGMEFYQKISKDADRPSFPILVLSARMDLQSLFTELHVDGFVVKPFQRANLLKEIQIILDRQYYKTREGHIRDVIIIDDHAGSSDIAKEFIKAGYKARVISSGIAGIEAVMENVPDLVLANLSLSDIAGDLVILRLKQMAKTKHVKYVLYVERNDEHDRLVMDKFSQKMGVQLMCEYRYPSELLESAIKVFKEIEEQL